MLIYDFTNREETMFIQDDSLFCSDTAHYMLMNVSHMEKQ
jgi:hypothetical protein